MEIKGDSPESKRSFLEQKYSQAEDRLFKIEYPQHTFGVTSEHEYPPVVGYEDVGGYKDLIRGVVIAGRQLAEHDADHSIREDLKLVNSAKRLVTGEELPSLLKADIVDQSDAALAVLDGKSENMIDLIKVVDNICAARMDKVTRDHQQRSKEIHPAGYFLIFPYGKDGVQVANESTRYLAEAKHVSQVDDMVREWKPALLKR